MEKKDFKYAYYEWKTSLGRLVLIKDMDLQHMRNCLRLVQRRESGYKDGIPYRNWETIFKLAISHYYEETGVTSYEIF